MTVTLTNEETRGLRMVETVPTDLVPQIWDFVPQTVKNIFTEKRYITFYNEYLYSEPNKKNTKLLELMETIPNGILKKWVYLGTPSKYKLLQDRLKKKITLGLLSEEFLISPYHIHFEIRRCIDSIREQMVVDSTENEILYKAKIVNIISSLQFVAKKVA